MTDTAERLENKDTHPEDVELYEQLAKLQDMYGQVGNLRSLLPGRLIGTTRLADRRSPEKFASSLRDAAASGSTQISSFKRAYHSDEMHQLWRTTNEADFPQGDDVWLIDYKSSLPDIRQARAISTMSNSNGIANDGEDQTNINANIEAFKAQYPSIELTTTAGALPIDLQVSSMKFHVDVNGASNHHPTYTVSFAGTETPSATQNAIMDFLHRRHQQASLADLLSLLASYQHFETQPCRKCNNVFDASLQLPLLREKVDTKDSASPSWNALHASCE